MSHGSTARLLALLMFASSASAATVGPAQGRPVAGRALEVNIPFEVDAPADRSCASANVRYGNGLVPRSTLHVQGRGTRRNLLVTSRASVNASTVTVNVQVGCGRKAVARRFVMPTTMPVAKGPSVIRTMARRDAPENAAKPRLRAAAPVAPLEPLFPPRDPEPAAEPVEARKVDAPVMDELQRARTEAATAMSQLEAARREMAAVLDVERRTSQTLIDADREVREARSEAERMRQLLNWIGAGLGLAAAGLAWIEANRLLSRRRAWKEPAGEEPAMLSGLEGPA